MHSHRHREGGLKEIRLRPGIAEHDLNVKLSALERFLDDGQPVRLTVVFRGREVVHPKNGERVIFALSSKVGDRAALQSGVRLEGRRMHATLVPRGKRNRA